MIDEELRETPFPKIWDNTMRASGHQCKRKLYWFLRGYDYKGKPLYFTWGSAFQEILVHWYSVPKPDDPSDQEFWDVAYEALTKGQDYYDDEAGDVEPTSKDNSRDNLERIFFNYIQTYPSESWEMIPGGAEVGWVWPIPNSDFMMGGSLDGRVQWDPYGALVLETKTTSEYLTDSFIARWGFSGQVTGYIWYLTQLLGDEVYGCLMNLITKKAPGPKSNWTTQRVVRDVVRKSKTQLDEFINSFLWDIASVKECWDRWYWPMTADPTDCTGGAGKAPCLFKNVCLQQLSYKKVDPLQFQGIQLRKGPWAPWDREGDQE